MERRGERDDRRAERPELGGRTSCFMFGLRFVRSHSPRVSALGLVSFTVKWVGSAHGSAFGVGVVLVAWLTINHSIIQRIHTMQHVRCFQGVLHPIGIALD